MLVAAASHVFQKANHCIKKTKIDCKTLSFLLHITRHTVLAMMLMKLWSHCLSHHKTLNPISSLPCLLCTLPLQCLTEWKAIPFSSPQPDRSITGDGLLPTKLRLRTTRSDVDLSSATGCCRPSFDCAAPDPMQIHRRRSRQRHHLGPQRQHIQHHQHRESSYGHLKMKGTTTSLPQTKKPVVFTTFSWPCLQHPWSRSTTTSTTPTKSSKAIPSTVTREARFQIQAKQLKK